MKVHFLKSSTVLIESRGVKILTDPWLVDGEYYGSWHHYPPFDFQPNEFDDVDYIYISHIHPDHFSRATLSQLNKDIPVLVHKYNAPFLKRNIESLGFQVRELPHNERTELRDGVCINILAADDCDPELCQKFFGCGIFESKDGSAQIDSLAVFDDGEFTVANVNDCPLQLARSAAMKIKQQYSAIDFLLAGYAGAGPFPQCFPFLGDEKIREAAAKKQEQFLKQGLDYLKLFQPRFYLPFAGTYTLGGKLADKNPFRGVPELEEALDWFEQHEERPDNCRGMLLNSGSCFDLAAEQPSQQYEPVDLVAKQTYIEDVLAKKSFPWESGAEPTLEELVELATQAYQRMEGVRTRLDFTTETSVVVSLVEGQAVRISMKGEGIEVIPGDETESIDPVVKLKVDPKLLGQILKGPRYGHWNNAEIGSHIEYYRNPEQYERGLYYCMNFFHA